MVTFIREPLWSRIRDELRSKAVGKVENLRLERYLVVERGMLEALRDGRQLNVRFIGFSGMKERCLEALEAYGSFRLTPFELHQPFEHLQALNLNRVSLSPSARDQKSMSKILGRMVV